MGGNESKGEGEREKGSRNSCRKMVCTLGLRRVAIVAFISARTADTTVVRLSKGCIPWSKKKQAKSVPLGKKNRPNVISRATWSLVLLPPIDTELRAPSPPHAMPGMWKLSGKQGGAPRLALRHCGSSLRFLSSDRDSIPVSARGTARDAPRDSTVVVVMMIVAAVAGDRHDGGEVQVGVSGTGVGAGTR